MFSLLTSPDLVCPPAAVQKIRSSEAGASFCAGELSALQELIGSTWLLFAEAPKLTLPGNEGWATPREQCRSPKQRVAPLQYPAPMRVLPPPTCSACTSIAPSCTSSLTSAYLPSALLKSLPWLLLFIPCMLESLLSFPKYVWQFTLFTEIFMYYLFLVLCLQEFRL